jgi:hypothetical protein
MADSHHKLFIVKSNDGSTVRLSLFEKLLYDVQSFEVVIKGVPLDEINHPSLKAGRLIWWSPYTREYYELDPDSDERRQQCEIVRQRIATRPDIDDDNEHVLLAFAMPSGYRVTNLNDPRRSSAQSACLPRHLSLGTMQSWVTRVFHERPLSSEELAELNRRTGAACERYSWPDLGKQYDELGEHEQTRNIAYLMLRREMSFRGAAFEYVAALERGSRTLAADAELDSAAASLLTAFADMDAAAIDLVANTDGIRYDA